MLEDPDKRAERICEIRCRKVCLQNISPLIIRKGGEKSCVEAICKVAEEYAPDYDEDKVLDAYMNKGLA